MIFLGIIILAMAFTGFYGALVGTIIILLSLLLMVRGYSVGNGIFTVHGLVWAKSYPLHTLCDIEHSPGITAGSIRTFAIGGLFSYLGYFQNERLGSYLSFVTDRAQEVVLYFNETVVIVVSPEDPIAFIEAVRHEYRRIRLN